MDRRKFLRSLPAAAVACAVEPSIAQDAPAVQSPEPSGFVGFVTPGCIDGPAARSLMPLDEPCPLPQSSRFKGIRFTGRQRNYLEVAHADTWYPSWAADGLLYSPYADGGVKDSSGRGISVNCEWMSDDYKNHYSRHFRDLGLSMFHGRITADRPKSTATGNAILSGDDPFNLTIKPLAPTPRETPRYEGYYPCANLYHKGVWYYGRYYCHRWLNTHNVPITYELGGFGGFRMSRDRGETWQDTPRDDLRPLFPETGRCSGAPAIKMGTPHFVDFGRELEHSPDGHAYLVGHGTYQVDGICNWSSGDAVSLSRVHPSPEAINDPDAYEFFCGRDTTNQPIWSKDFSRISPMIQWPGHAGCTNITYHPYLKKYFGFICAGWADGDAGSYDTWMVESDAVTGPWSKVAYMRGMGGQAYFVCMPSKFIRPDSNKIVLFYADSWAMDRAGIPSWKDPRGPGGEYTLCVAEFELE